MARLINRGLFCLLVVLEKIGLVIEGISWNRGMNYRTGCRNEGVLRIRLTIAIDRYVLTVRRIGGSRSKNQLVEEPNLEHVHCGESFPVKLRLIPYPSPNLPLYPTTLTKSALNLHDLATLVDPWEKLLLLGNRWQGAPNHVPVKVTVSFPCFDN